MFSFRASVSSRKLQKNTMRPLLVPLVLLVGVVASSTASIFIRYAQNDAASIVIAAYRLAIATVLLSPVVYVRQRRVLRGMESKQWILALAAGGFLGLHFLTWITSLEYTTVASSTIFVSSLPVFVALLSPLFLNEKPAPVLYAGMALAILGGVIMAISDTCVVKGVQFSCPPWRGFVQGSALYGDGLAVLGAITGAGYFMIGRYMRVRLPLLTYIFVVYGMAALIMLVMVAMTGLPILGYSKVTYLWFLLLAVVPQLIGHSSFNWALGYLPVSYVTIAAIGEPVAATALAWIILHESPTWLQIVGGALCLAGISYASRKL